MGVGAAAPGEGFVSLGTSGVIFSVTDKYVSLPERTLHAFCHALPGRWHGMAVMLSAAASLSWVAHLTGHGAEIGKLAAGAEAFANSAENVRTAPIFLPYLSGERTPHNDATASAGCSPDCATSMTLWRWPMRCWRASPSRSPTAPQVLREAGAAPTRPLLVGGGARSRYWGQLIADATGLTIDLAEGAEAGAALGAARLGMLAAKAGTIAAICVKPPIVASFKPDASRGELLAPRLKRYRALYGAEKATRI